MHASFAIIAAMAAAAPTYGLVARGQDSSNFLADTAPQGYTQLISQISDGQVQNPTPVPPVDYPTVIPTVVVPSVSSPAISLPVETPVVPPIPTSVEVTLPVETPILPTTVAPPPVVPSSVGTPSIGTPSTSIVAPSQTTSVSPPPAETTPPTNGAAGIKAFSSFGLMAGVAALFLA